MVIMDALCIPFIFCIIMFELNYVICANDRSLRKLKQRIEMIEFNNHKRINDLELEVRSLRIELDEQKARTEILESMMNSSEANIRASTSDSHGYPITGVTELTKESLDEQSQHIREQVPIDLQNQLQNVSAKQKVLEGKITKLDKHVTETCVPVQSMTNFSETLKKAFGEEKSLARKFFEVIEQSVQTQNSQLANISNSLMKSMENDMVSLITEQNRNFTLQLDENIKRLNGSVDKVQIDLNLLKINHTLIQALVDKNTAMLDVKQHDVTELKTDLAEAKRQLQNLEEEIEQSVRTQNRDLQNISNTLSTSVKSMENDMDTLITEKNRNFTLQSEENIERLNGSVYKVQIDLNLLKINHTLIQTLVDKNTAMLDVEQHDVTELKTDLAEAKRQLKTLEEVVEQVGSRLEYYSTALVFDCKDILKIGKGTSDGVYHVRMKHTLETIPVYCDMTTDGGGWTVFQKRFNGGEDFYKNFHDYENGFGSLSGEFWLGLKYIYQMTEGVTNELRIDLEKSTGEKGYAVYQLFSISGPSDYRLNIGDYRGTAGDGGEGLSYNDGFAFSTYDKGDTFCGKKDRGGWWFYDCTYANLNGEYVTPGTKYSNRPVTYRFVTPDIIDRGQAGVFYYTFDGLKSLKSTEMKFRRKY